MATETQDDGGDEYRPTDWLAVCGRSYGIGFAEDRAIQAVLRYAGPFRDDRETVTVAVWELYADSWQSHGPGGPERGAEQISFRELEIDPEQADRVAELATEGHIALDRALADAEEIEAVEGPAQ